MNERGHASGEYLVVPAVRRGQGGAHAQVAITIHATSDHAFWADLTMEVDKCGGVFVATYEALVLGTLVDMELELPDGGDPIAVTGVVRWTRPHIEGSDGATGVGVKFLSLTDDERRRVVHFSEKIRQPMIFDLDEAPIRSRRGAAA